MQMCPRSQSLVFPLSNCNRIHLFPLSHLIVPKFSIRLVALLGVTFPHAVVKRLSWSCEITLGSLMFAMASHFQKCTGFERVGLDSKLLGTSCNSRLLHKSSLLRSSCAAWTLRECILLVLVLSGLLLLSANRESFKFSLLFIMTILVWKAAWKIALLMSLARWLFSTKNFSARQSIKNFDEIREARVLGCTD